MTPDLRWPLPDHLDLRERLVTAWSSDRGYHDLQHLEEVLARLTELGAGDDVEVVLAAWFHDAVYDDAGNNEERSALLATEELSGIRSVDADEVARLVRLTERHRPEPGDRAGEVLCDADLAILAAPADRYATYVAGVRREYAAVPDDDFRRGRAAILRDLLDKPTLFHTAYAREHWEPTARANLAAELTGP
ncbi:hypothetical protein ncot_15950 [Nocardioides sp. JQ2195]|uniref:HD domain-containing protein n=1 Tax=Nocardioides sp. JQ2195 TaxID=2592334 RepID=UPI00143E150A|nr:hypothetical protein [Nocardioides sp. JQ2195]QIX27913.1 hypothetical protein ncot_15950 [Nocardioides sp. JQ2195]